MTTKYMVTLKIIIIIIIITLKIIKMYIKFTEYKMKGVSIEHIAF